jgi:aldose 1-epimerase
MTCAPNSFNNKNGLLTLEPLKNYKWKVDLKF